MFFYQHSSHTTPGGLALICDFVTHICMGKYEDILLNHSMEAQGSTPLKIPTGRWSITYFYISRWIFLIMIYQFFFFHQSIVLITYFFGTIHIDFSACMYPLFRLNTFKFSEIPMINFYKFTGIFFNVFVYLFYVFFHL